MNVALDIPFEEAPDTLRTLRADDVLRIVKRLVELRDGKGEVDDIDHLGNRRVRSVGELMENQYRMGLLRMERAIRERMSSEVLANVKPQDLVNAKPIAAVIREFSVLHSCRSLWIKTIRCPKLPTNVVCRHWGRAVCPANAPVLKSATYIRPITDAFARLRRRKARTSV